MPKQYEFGDTCVKNLDPSLTEQEWKDMCDINLMLKSAARGAMVMGSSQPLVYGEDDMTMDAVAFRIKKAKLEQEMAKIAKETEFTEEEIEKIPPKVREKFSFRKKAPKDPAAATTAAAPTAKDAPTTPKKEPEVKPQA